ncbi:MAG: hypothetical protein GF421_09630 [Candidatus Aminicenantes bacterium]|nr:hypothetical protein [Candidatus Aminicenantes bacterium]
MRKLDLEINNIAYQGAILWAIFLVLGAALSLLIRPFKERNFFSRLKVWLFIIPVFLSAIYLGKWGFFGLVVFCFSASYYEIARLNKEMKFWPHFFSIMLALPWIIVAQLFEYNSWLIIPALLASAMVLYVFISWKQNNPWNLPVFSLILGVSLSYWLYLYGFAGFRLPLFVFSVVSLCDVMAFVCGRLLGRFKPFSKISPHKTAAGYLGGFLSALAAVFLFRFAVPNLNFFQLIFTGFLLVASGIIGDLLGSKIKRLYNVKDFSHLLGPMGGIIDRLDSLLITMGTFYFYLVVFIK